jgi:hypothetical protein
MCAAAERHTCWLPPLPTSSATSSVTATPGSRVDDPMLLDNTDDGLMLSPSIASSTSASSSASTPSLTVASFRGTPTSSSGKRTRTKRSCARCHSLKAKCSDERSAQRRRHCSRAASSTVMTRSHHDVLLFVSCSPCPRCVRSGRSATCADSEDSSSSDDTDGESESGADAAAGQHPQQQRLAPPIWFAPQGGYLPFLSVGMLPSAFTPETASNFFERGLAWR